MEHVNIHLNYLFFLEKMVRLLWYFLEKMVRLLWYLKNSCYAELCSIDALTFLGVAVLYRHTFTDVKHTSHTPAKAPSPPSCPQGLQHHH